MKLVTFEVQTLLGRFLRLGALLPASEQFVVDLNAAYAWLLSEDGEGEPEAQRLADVIVPPSMRRFIEMGSRALDAGRDTVYQLNQLFLEKQQPKTASAFVTGLNQARLLLDLKSDEIRLTTPLPDPNMYRDFFAHEKHVAVGYQLREEPIPEAWYKIPVYYKGNHRSLIGPNQPMTWPRYTRKLDYELELGCVLGKQGRNLSPQEAADCIFGYTIVNDFSARDIQRFEMQCRLGPAKGKDFATAVGPYIVTKDEIADINALKMTAHVNGKQYSEGLSGDAHFSFEEMIAHLSQDETVYPGDLIASGTVGTGCGLENGYWLQPGDEIVLAVDGLGELRNTILPAEAETNLLEAFPNKVSKIKSGLK